MLREIIRLLETATKEQLQTVYSFVLRLLSK